MFWQAPEDFSPEFKQADEFDFLNPTPEKEDLARVDLFIFLLKGWDDVDNIGGHFSMFSQVFDLIDRDQKQDNASFDFLINKGADSYPVRLLFMNLELMPLEGASDQCVAEMVYAVAMHDVAFKKWFENGCKND